MNMSNKEILEQHNAKLSENSTDLGSILETINKLPTVEEVKLQEKSVIPTTETQEVVADEEYTGLSKVTVEKITGDTLEVTPNTQQQSFSGVYTDVKVAGDENLIAENIKKDVEIFGVLGTAETGNAEMMTYPDITSLSVVRLLLKIPELNTSNITYMTNAFQNCSSLTKIPNIDTSSVISMEQMFSGCSSLTEIPNMDTGNVTNMNSMFRACSNLTKIPNIDTSSVTKMSNMFYGCSSLTEIPNMDTGNVTNMTQMFEGCSNLTEIPNMDTSSVTEMYRTFLGCVKLKTIPKLNASKVTSVRQTFENSKEIESLGGLENLGKSYTKTTVNYNYYICDISYSTQLTHESLMNVINNLYDLNLTYNVANGGTLYTQRLTLGSRNLAKLTADEIAIATNKGWSVS
jgi:surface protein